DKDSVLDRQRFKTDPSYRENQLVKLSQRVCVCWSAVIAGSAYHHWVKFVESDKLDRSIDPNVVRDAITVAFEFSWSGTQSTAQEATYGAWNAAVSAAHFDYIGSGNAASDSARSAGYSAWGAAAETTNYVQSALESVHSAAESDESGNFWDFAFGTYCNAVDF